CVHCAGARASQLEVRVALARSAGNPHAFVVPRPVIRPGTLVLWVALALGIGLLAGWGAHQRWGGPGSGAPLEETRGTIIVQQRVPHRARERSAIAVHDSDPVASQPAY